MAVADEARVSDSVDEVINQVLAAERAAGDAVDRCRAEAAQVLAEAEETVRRIATRTERRIKLAHRTADEAVERTLRDLQDPGLVSADEAPDVGGDGLVDRAVDQLVAEMLTGKP